METMDDATLDAVLALQLQDLRDLGEQNDTTGHDATDFELALDAYRQELRQAATHIRDHRLGTLLGDADQDEPHLPLAIPSNTPLFDALNARLPSPVPFTSNPPNPNDEEARETLHEHTEETHEVDNTAAPAEALESVESVQSSVAQEPQLEGEPDTDLPKSSHSLDPPEDDSEHTPPPVHTNTSKMAKGSARATWLPTQHLDRMYHAIRTLVTIQGRWVQEVLQNLNQCEDQQLDASKKAEGLCIACREAIPPDQSEVLCGDRYCHPCIVRLFEAAMKDEASFPPGFCGQQIPLEPVKHLFGEEFPAAFRERGMELSTSDRVYCSDCSSFINPDFVKGDKATCAKCSSTTCIICRRVAHKGSDCPQDPAVVSLMTLAETQGYKQCLSCHRLVEIEFGCNHVT